MDEKEKNTVELLLSIVERADLRMPLLKMMIDDTFNEKECEKVIGVINKGQHCFKLG